MSDQPKIDLNMRLVMDAFKYAREKGHTELQPIHLLIAMTKDPEAEIFFGNVGLDFDRLKEAVEKIEPMVDAEFGSPITPDGMGAPRMPIPVAEHVPAVLLNASIVSNNLNKNWTTYAEILTMLGSMGDNYSMQTIRGFAQYSDEELGKAMKHPKAQWTPHKPLVASTSSEFNKANDPKVALELADILKAKVYDQDRAIDSLHSSMKIAAAELDEEDKPNGSYLFAGPTGVGKTEVAKQLAKARGVKLIRIDMSEYQEKHNVSRLVGSPPGYVGHGEEGILDQLLEDPDAVVLFDEIEKAHPDVYNTLLQIMDNGILTKGNNDEIDFRRATLIMTSNVGARNVEEQAGKLKMGFGTASNDNTESEEIYRRAINERFPPEFRNRLDGIITFGKLSPETVLKVTRKFVSELNELRGPMNKNINITATDESIKALADMGYDDKMGARPLKRTIASKIKEPLAHMILEDGISDVNVEIQFDPKTGEFFLDTVDIPAEDLENNAEPANDNPMDDMELVDLGTGPKPDDKPDEPNMGMG